MKTRTAGFGFGFGFGFGRSRARGQAVVELGLGSLVFVTVLMFGIHFGEMGWAGAKIHEANASALWDSTAWRSYQFGDWYDSARVAVPEAHAAAQRYTDWDGRASAEGTAPKLALTQAGPMTLRCTKASTRAFALEQYAPRFGESAGVACSVEAELRPIRIPSKFLEGAGGFSAEQHVQRSDYTLCGTGSLTSGSCGSLSLLLGDDALNHGADQLECPLTGDSPIRCPGNGKFYDVTLDTWNRSMQLSAGWSEGWTGAPERFASNIAPGLPRGRITGFYMSFRGEESGFTELTRGGGAWQTNPLDAVMATGVAEYRGAYSARQQCSGGGFCWLGRYSCN